MIGKPPAIDAWIIMLRTTTFKQGFGAFVSRDADGNKCYCPLAILCLANGEHPGSELCGNWNFVQQHIRRHAMTDVYYHNDVDHWTFKQLADWADGYLADPSTWAAPTGASQS